MWVWLGDSAYFDYPNRYTQSQPLFHLKERYQSTKEAAGYAELARERKVIGVWDDHDYGKNDGDRTFEFKHRNRELFLDFIEEPFDSERRIQKELGIY